MLPIRAPRLDRVVWVRVRGFLVDCTYPVLHDLSMVVWGSIAGCGSANVRIAGFGEHPSRRVIVSYFPLLAACS